MKLSTLITLSVVALLAASLASAGHAIADTATADPPTAASTSEIPLDPAFSTGQLENGLTWYVRTNNEPEQRAFLNLVVQVGSLQEDEDQLGLAHFLEHMAFNGTENFAKQELIDYLETIGMEFGPDINAYTSYDETVYMLALPTDDTQYLETGMQILADWSRRISLDEEEVVRERGVVLDEWRSRLGAGQRIYEQESELLYAGSRYVDRLPIGKPEIIESAGPAAIRRFYEDWYRPELMAVVAVGDFDEERVLELIHEHFDEDWGPEQSREKVTTDLQPHAETLWGLITDPEGTSSVAQVILKERHEPTQTLAEYREAIARNLVGRLYGARMSELSNANEAVFTSASLSAGSALIPGWITPMMTVRAPDDELEAGFEQAMTEWRRVSLHGFAATELERTKASWLRSLEVWWNDRDNQHSSRLARRMTGVIMDRATFPGPEWTLQTSRELFPTITIEDLQAVVESLDFERESDRVVITNTPELVQAEAPTREQLTAAMATASAAQPDPWVDEVRDEPLIADLPTPGSVVNESYDEDLDLTIWTLSNGVQVLVKPTDFKEDSFTLTGFSTGGRSLGSEERNASQDIATSIVSAGGAGDFSAIELRKMLADKAAFGWLWIRTYQEGMSARGSADDLDTALQMLWLDVMQPRRDEAAVQSTIRDMATRFENQSLNPDWVYSDSLNVILHDHHPRASRTQSDEIRAIDLDTSMEFYRDRFADLSDLVVVVVGAVELDTLRPLVEQYLATLPVTGREESWRDTGMRMIDGPLHRVIATGVDDKARTSLVMHGTAEWNRLNRYGLSVLARALEIRLREILREDMSGTYGVSVAGSSSAWPESTWQLNISFGCEPARLDELVDETLKVLQGARAEGLPAEYLEKVREQDLRSNEENTRNNSYWVSVLAFRARYGIDQREELNTREFVQDFSEQDFRDAAERCIQTGRMIRIDKVPAQTP